MLKPLTNLTELDLRNSSQITDAGLTELRGLKNLTRLDLGDDLLGGTQITDAGLKELRELKNLTTLNLSNTRVTDAGLTELSKSLPSVQILR